MISELDQHSEFLLTKLRVFKGLLQEHLPETGSSSWNFAESEGRRQDGGVTDVIDIHRLDTVRQRRIV